MAPEVSLDYTDNFFIPVLTPFELDGAGSDPDGDPLTFIWEEIDLGPECVLQDPISSAPLFRTYPSGPKTNRYFPKLSTVLNNSFDVTEQLPTITRDMTFRLIARDNKSNGGGVAWKDVAFKAWEGAGPFTVLSPNTSADTWLVGEYKNVQWDVSNTDIAPVNCSFVNIRLSTDGGLTYPIVLAENVPNDGSQLIQVPVAPSAQARLRVDAANSVFFDVSDANFKIIQPTQATLALGLSNDGGRICLPGQFESEVLSVGLLGYSNIIQVDLLGNLPPGATYQISNTSFSPGDNCQLSIDLSAVNIGGAYDLQMRSISANDTVYIPIHFDLVRNDFSQMSLLEPADGLASVLTSQPLVLRWTSVPDAEVYDVQMSTSPGFEQGTIVASKTGTEVDTFRITVALLKNQIYYWRVRPVNSCGVQEWLDTRSLQTEVLACSIWEAFDLPKTLTSNGTPTIESKINVIINGNITDVNVKQLSGYHSFFKDLDAKLISPQGTELQLFAQKCGNSSGSFNFGLDDEALGGISCPPSNNGATYKPENPLSIFDGEPLHGSWTLRVHDNQISSGGAIEGFQLEFCAPAQFNNPFLVNNNVLMLAPGTNQPITQDLLLAEDVDNTPNELVFHLVNTPKHGRLERNWSGELKPGDTFTQSELSGGAIRYFNYSFTTEGDYFSFTVTDPEGGFLGTPRFVMQSSTSVGTNSIATAWDVTLFPNPAMQRVSLRTPRPMGEDTRVLVLNAAGSLVRQMNWSAGNDNLALDLGGLSAGIYWVQCRNGQESVVKRLVVVR
ncbi:MAG: T9SS type A sorting domain-containing protein [Lewinellaceae bacterium]|nr:T9SS type A sorting domain-containing protein [Lewinellaceae bacterium]